MADSLDSVNDCLRSDFKMRKVLVLSLLFCLLGSSTSFATEHSEYEVRTYMPFSYPIDPAKVRIIPERKLSYALSNTLVEWDNGKGISVCVAESRKAISSNTFRFKIASNAKWSDGTPITAKQVKTSFDHSLKRYPQDLRCLNQILDRIEVHSPTEVDFVLKVPTQESGLLSKLAMPNLGVVWVKSNGQIDLSISSGPFYLDPGSTLHQIELKRNLYLPQDESKGVFPSKIIIRKPKVVSGSNTRLLSDSWPNLIESSLAKGPDVLDTYKKRGFEIWRSPLDRLCNLQLGKKGAERNGTALLRLMRNLLSPKDIVSDLSGVAYAPQIYPRGYPLYDPKFSCVKTADTLPTRYRTKPVEILMSQERISPEVKAKIQRLVFQATGIQPRFIEVALEEVPAVMKLGNFDFYAGTDGLAEPDPEQALSFYLESQTPLILPMFINFLHRFDAARKMTREADKLNEMRSILRDAVCEGHILPLFHSSTFTIGSPEFDFTQAPYSDEYIEFFNLRFKRAISGGQ